MWLAMLCAMHPRVDLGRNRNSIVIGSMIELSLYVVGQCLMTRGAKVRFTTAAIPDSLNYSITDTIFDSFAIISAPSHCRRSLRLREEDIR